jgi:UDP-N-acetyl-D-mannosaminuronic acid transferase (WecB/TagA/CpsF family)
MLIRCHGKFEESPAEVEQQAEDKRRWQAQQANNRQIRKAPKAPELGATLQESQTLCEQQTGILNIRRSTVGAHAACQVGGVPIFEALFRKGESGISSLTVYFEQGDVKQLRKVVQDDQGGPPNDSGVSDGFRFWAWYGEGRITRVSVYSTGVSLSVEELR